MLLYPAMRTHHLGVALAALALLTACGGSDEPAAEEPANTPTTTLEATPEATADASPTPVPPNVGDSALRLGDTRQGLFASVTLQEIKFPLPPMDEFRTPTNEGDVFLGLRIKQCLSDSYDPAQYGGEAFYSTFNGDWYASSPSGEQVSGNGSSWDDWPRPKFPESVTMNPGDCLKGWIATEVPRNFKIEKMIWRPGGETVAEWLP